MGGKSGGKAPKAPDPNVLSDAQTRSNQDTAAFNAALGRYNTYTPYGSQEFSQTGTDASGAPIYRQDINLSPEQQRLFDLQQQQNVGLGELGNSQVSQMQQMYGQALDPSGVDGYRQQAQDALYNRNTEYLDRDFNRFEDRERNRLANQGVVEGSEAYNAAMDRFGQGKETAYRQARNESIIGGGAEADRSMQQLFALRNQPINEFNALRGASQIEVPNFQNPATQGANPTDVAGNYWNAYQGNLNAYNARQASNNSLLGSLASLGGSLGGAWIAASDERLKEDIDHTGSLPDGTNVYEYTFKPTGERQTGVMAQEVEKSHPDSVVTTPSGFKMVDYGKVLARALMHAESGTDFQRSV